MKPKMMTGTVRTDKVGSDCEFEICLKEEWDAMTEEERESAILEAMWGSGLVSVFANE